MSQYVHEDNWTEKLIRSACVLIYVYIDRNKTLDNSSIFEHIYLSIHHLDNQLRQRILRHKGHAKISAAK